MNLVRRQLPGFSISKAKEIGDGLSLRTTVRPLKAGYALVGEILRFLIEMFFDDHVRNIRS
jgi:hypothetical protein